MKLFILGLVLGGVVGSFGMKVCIQKTLHVSSVGLEMSGKVFDSSAKFIGKVAK
jgi:hypothetical protein